MRTEAEVRDTGLKGWKSNPSETEQTQVESSSLPQARNEKFVE